MTPNVKMVPPDGGWGWVIMFAYVLSSFIYIPVQQNFGLVFKDAFQTMDLSGTNVVSIISTHTATCSLVGTITGPLLKHFSVRQVSLMGALFYVTGILSMSFAYNYIHFIIGYGLFTGIGLGTLRLTHSLALNLYFQSKRRKVTGISLALRSLGSMVAPQAIVLLLSIYGTRSTVLLLGGICLHTLCTALLLQPVQWHMKEITYDNGNKVCNNSNELVILIKRESVTAFEIEQKNDLVEEHIKTKKNILKKIIDIFDLALLANPIFLSITVGMIFSVFADLSFSTLFAFILTDLGFDNNRIATFISTSYISNVIVRITIPFVGDYFKRSSRFMYLLSCILVILGRFAIIHFSQMGAVTFIAIVWGAAKGVRTVYWSVIMADNMPAHKLAAAESIQMVLNGFVLLACGPLLGVVKDLTGTYVSCIYVLNAVTSVTVVLWITEMIYYRIKKNKKIMLTK